MSKPKMLGRASGFVPNSKADQRRGARTAKRWETMSQRWDWERLDKMDEDQRRMEKMKMRAELSEQDQEKLQAEKEADYAAVLKIVNSFLLRQEETP